MGDSQFLKIVKRALMYEFIFFLTFAGEIKKRKMDSASSWYRGFMILWGILTNLCYLPKVMYKITLIEEGLSFSRVSNGQFRKSFIEGSKQNIDCEKNLLAFL